MPDRINQWSPEAEQAIMRHAATIEKPAVSPLRLAFDVIERLANDQLHRAKARGLMAGYDVRWREHSYTVVGVEETITAPLVNIATGKPSRTFDLAGKLDVRLVDEAGRKVIMDHKTTSESLEDPNSDYWRQLIVESQPSHYMLLEWMNERKVDYCVWDVIRKPGIAPKGVSKTDVQMVLRNGEYCGTPISLQAQTELEQTGRENFEMYEARLKRDCTVDRPEFYFARRSIPRLDNELIEYAGELWMHAEDIRLAIAGNRHPRTAKACIGNYGTCKFLTLCSGHDSPDSERWKRKPWVHPELPILSGEGKDYLTNSRIGCFQACKRMHQLNYLIGIERMDADQDALIFGNLMHEALAAWWSAQNERTQ